MKRRNAIGAVLVAVMALGASIYAFTAPGAGAAGSVRAATAAGQGMNISVTGLEQGDFTPGKTIPILNVSHEIVVPFDAVSGLATGRRLHKPISVTMKWGPTTPMFLESLVSNETLTSVLIGLLKDRTGATLATITLTNAKVSHFVQTGQTVHFEFTYQTITWASVGGISTTDDWAPAT